MSIPAATLREHFHLRNGDLFNVSEVRAGLERVKRSYDAKGYGDALAEPDITIDHDNHIISIRLHVDLGLSFRLRDANAIEASMATSLSGSLPASAAPPGWLSESETLAELDRQRADAGRI
jgi:hypothetical protein